MSNKVIGQNKIKELFLKTLSSGKTGHCYTLVGEAGMGKSTFTSYISKMIVCERKNACGVCKSCIMAEAGTHPDIIRIVPEEDKTSIGINVMRGMVEDIYIRPYSADKKVYIINNFEKALIPAQNAVLKALEEPPEYVVFLLTVSSEKDVLETVKSRSVMLKMMPYTREEIKLALTEHISEKDAEFISGLCGGNIGKGLRLTQNESFKELRKNIFAALDELIKNGRIMPFAEVFKKENTDNVSDVLECTLGFFRDMLMHKISQEELIINKDYIEKTKELADKVRTHKILAVIEDLIKTGENLRRNINYNLAVMSVVFGSMEEING